MRSAVVKDLALQGPLTGGRGTRNHVLLFFPLSLHIYCAYKSSEDLVKTQTDSMGLSGARVSAFLTFPAVSSSVGSTLNKKRWRDIFLAL